MDPGMGHGRSLRRASEARDELTYRAVQLASGRLLPIEARLGARVLRFITIDSDEGRRLLDEGRVEIVRGGVRRTR
ncbi:MAG: hypothetical protein Kow0062_00290 [Acidobacteriota bacterium]|nr:MAG: hypothetical protein D6738_05940 [Acidobacteriota bacterium]